MCKLWDELQDVVLAAEEAELEKEGMPQMPVRPPPVGGQGYVYLRTRIVKCVCLE